MAATYLCVAVLLDGEARVDVDVAPAVDGDLGHPDSHRPVGDDLLESRPKTPVGRSSLEKHNMYVETQNLDGELHVKVA